MSRGALSSAIAVVITITGCATDDPDLAATGEPVVDPSSFVLPMLSDAQRAQIVAQYAYLDPTGQVPRGMLEDAIEYYDVNQKLIPQNSYFVVIDLSQYSGHDRFWLVDLTTGEVENHKVAHGKNSDPDNDGYATLVSNTPNSEKSSLGFFLTGEIYDGSHPHSMRIDGLSPDGSPNGMADTNVRARAVIVHEASYVDDSNTSQQGRSNGCFALDPGIELGMVNRIHDGTLMYAAISPLNPPVGSGSACGAVGASGAIVDDSDSCFMRGGPSQYLRDVTGSGMHGTLVWTHTTQKTSEINFGQWNFNFAQAGQYHVEAYTPAAYAQSRQAHYIVHAGGTDHVVTIDQTAHDGYQSLGDFNFAQGGSQYIHLGDDTDEPGTAIQLVFDAIRITPASGSTSARE